MHSELLLLAEKLESLLPAVLRQLYPAEENEPLADLPLMQLRVIRCLADGPKSVSALASELRMSPSRLAHLLARLEEPSLIARTEDPKDRRIRFASLTDKGKSLLDKRRQVRSARLCEVLETMSDCERTTVEEALALLHEKSRHRLPSPIDIDLEPTLP